MPLRAPRSQKRDLGHPTSRWKDKTWATRQRRYYDFNVLTHAKFVEKLRYMHRNPVKRGLVDTPEQWPWSSFRHYLTGAEGRIEIESHWTWKRRERSSPPHP